MGLPEFVPDLVGMAGAIVLVLILVAIGGIVYKTMTGGIEWPEDRDDDTIRSGEAGVVREGDDDDEWKYY